MNAVEGLPLPLGLGELKRRWLCSGSIQYSVARSGSGGHRVASSLSRFCLGTPLMIRPLFRNLSQGMIAAAALASSVAVVAADSGWYLRGSLGLERPDDADFSDRDCASKRPAALFGCVRGDDGKPIGAYGDFGRYPVLELGIGKRLLPWLRTDLSLGYSFNSDYRGNANFLSVGWREPVSAELNSWTGMLNAFVDLAPLSDADLGRFEPYVGVGLGVAHHRLGRMTYLFPQNPYRHKMSVTPGGDRTQFAYRLALGTGVRLSARLLVDLTAYFADLGKVGTDVGLMQMNHVPTGILIDETEASLRGMGLSIGLRYAF